VAFSENTILIIIDLPLIETNNEYDIYEIHNLPIPNPKLKPENDKDPLDRKYLVSKYQLETNFIAVDKRRTKYILLNDAEAGKCMHAPSAFCDLKESCLPYKSE
jgi:hypothetical protein